MSYGICQLPLRVFVFPGFLGLRVSLLASLSASLCCSESVDSELRICEFTPTTACVMFHVFFQFPEFTSRQDALPTVFNSGSVHTLPIEQASTVQQILFRGVMTPSLLPVRPGLH